MRGFNRKLLQPTANHIRLFRGLLDSSYAVWSGSCVNGLAQGRGTLTWYNEGRSFFTEEFTGTNGLVMNAGRAAASDAVNERAVVWKVLSRCPSQGKRTGLFYRSAAGRVSTELNLGFRVVSDKLLKFGVQFVSQSCPFDTLANISISLYQRVSVEKPTGFTGGQVVEGSTGSDGVDFQPSNSCRDDSYRNFPCFRRLDAGEAALRAAADQRAQEAERVRQEVERQQMAQAAERARQQKAELRAQMKSRLGNFLKQNAASALVPLKDLRDNPFRYEGATVAVQARYIEMLSRELSHFQWRICCCCRARSTTLNGTTC